MRGFEGGDIVRVPFPSTDRTTTAFRLALIVSRQALGDSGGLLWVLMMNSAENRGWPGDVPINDHLSAGLPMPSIVRTAKIATIEASRAAPIGRLAPSTWDEVLRHIMANVGLV